MVDVGLSLRGLDPTLHAARRARLRGLTDGLPVIVYGAGSALGAGTRSHGGMRFLTGWDSHETGGLLLLGKTMDRLLLSSPFMVASARSHVPELSPGYLPISHWSEVVSQFLDWQTPMLIGIDEMPMGWFRQLTPHLDHGIDATPRLDALRQVKEPAARDLHRSGAAICDRLFAALPGAIQLGRRGYESQRILEDLARQHGADYCRTWLTMRPQADHPRYWPEETENPAQIGDQVLFGVALTVDGHWAHGIRMGHLGPIPKAVAQLHAQVANALRLGMAALRPGVSISEAVKAMDLLVRSSNDAATRFRAGHGLGLTYEEPGLTTAFPQTFGAHPEPAAADTGPILHPGMVLELHPNLFVDGVGGAALGQMFEITQIGAKPLLQAPMELFSL